ncbi:MAG: signal peptidase II [Clostridia bacterium]|nr:signal peptidase II [Clostridia bacterium]
MDSSASKDRKFRTAVRIAVQSVLIALLIGVDHALKLWAQRALGGGRVLQADGFMALRYQENSGAAFSMLSGRTSVLIWLTGAVLLGCIVYLFLGRSGSRLTDAALLLVVAGGAGNLIDRIRLGYVIDYIEPLFVNFAVFNFADCLITVGAALLLVWAILGARRDKRGKEKP